MALTNHLKITDFFNIFLLYFRNFFHYLLGFQIIEIKFLRLRYPGICTLVPPISLYPSIIILIKVFFI